MGQNSDDDLTASIYVIVQLKQITHCLNVLSGQVEPDAEEYSYQFSVKIIGLPEINSNETAPETSSFCVKLFQEMGAEVSIFDTNIVHRVSRRGCVTLFTIFLKSSQVSSQQLHMGRGGGWYSWWGYAARFTKSRPYFDQKNAIFYTRSQTRLLKSKPFSDLAFRWKLCHHFLD